MHHEFKGTPGPWDYGWEVQPNGCPTVGHKGLMVCMVAHSAKEPDQKEIALANADLISAAPQLLAALQLMVATYPYSPPCHGWESQVEAHVAAKQAINKALSK